MSLLRQNNRKEVSIERPLAEVFRAFQAAGGKVGKVKDAMIAMGSLTVKVGINGFSNPATVRITMEPVSAGRTRVRFQSDSLDGMVGMGSAGRAIDRIMREVNFLLFPDAGSAPEEKSNVKTLLIVAALVALGIALALWAVRHVDFLG